jgi:hypothetical protein
MRPDGTAMLNRVLQPGGGVTITASVFQLIQVGYSSTSIQIDKQIVGGPGWLKSERFDVIAKATSSWTKPVDRHDCWRCFVHFSNIDFDCVRIRSCARRRYISWCGRTRTDRLGRSFICRHEIVEGLSGRWDAQIDFVPTFVPGPSDSSVPVSNPAADSGPSMLSPCAINLG